MIDLETLSVKPNASIISIGAVKFDIDSCDSEIDLSDMFYQLVDLRESPKSLDIDASTIIWWMDQSDEARKKITGDLNSDNLEHVLISFSEFFIGSNYLWGNGANFDNIILRNAYDVCGLEAPWKYYNDRCYRTIAAMNKHIPKVEPTIPHHALYDALAQAKHLFNIHNDQG